MQNSQFFTLARTLSAAEFSDFNKYLKRLHRKDDVALVFDYLRKLHPSGFQDDKKLEIGYAFQKVFKKPMDTSDANRVKILNILSDLNLRLKDFLWLEKAKSGSFESQAYWMAILKERGLKATLSKKAALLQRDMEALPKTSVADYMKGMVANYFYYYHLIPDKQTPEITALVNCGADMDLFYAVSRLKIACEMANRQNLMSLKPNLEVLPAIMELTKTMAMTEHPLLALYFRVYELIAEKRDQRYAEIEALLVTHVESIEPEEMQAIVGYLHNYAAAQIRQGDETYWEMTHRINKFGVAHGVFIGSGEISPGQFNNIVNAACVTKDFAWATAFMKSHQLYLQEAVRKETILLAEGLCFYGKKEYKKALDKLKAIETTSLLPNIRTKTLMMKIYYDDKDMDVDVEAYCIAFELYLKRHRTPKREAVEATLNTVRIAKMLARRKATKANILKEIETTTPLYLKAWLTAKAEEYRY